MEVFLETVQLQEIRQLERAHIAAGVSDFLLEVTHDLGQVLRGKACAEELIPKPLPVEAQRELLSGPLAVEPMSLRNELGCVEGWSWFLRHNRARFQEVEVEGGKASAAAAGTRSMAAWTGCD